MALHPTLTPAEASAALAELGIPVAPGNVRLGERDGRWVAMLPDERMAWFAASDAGRACMLRERRVLYLLAQRCRFVAPRVLFESPDGDIDVRAMVPGRHDVAAVLRRLLGDAAGGAAVGAALGSILAELHTAVAAEDVAGWLPRRPEWPRPRLWVHEHLPAVVDDATLCRAADGVMARWEEVHERAPDSDRALVHADLGLHNLGIDPVALQVAGVFDWESACWADRHLDFRYLEFAGGRRELLDGTVAAYELATGYHISLNRVSLYNAAAAITYLAYRVGVPPERSWCGRTLAEDLDWTRRSLAQVQGAPAQH